jgi:c-di-GMP-binding flagellar brake protein YcgR
MGSQANNFHTDRSPRRVFNRAVGILRDGKFELAQALQISESGMALVTPHALAVGSRLVITLVIPSAEGLVLRAIVVAERDPVGNMRTYGIQFSSMHLHERRMIRSYVSAKTQAEAEDEKS